MQFEDFALKNEPTCFCEPIKGRSKTEESLLALLQESFPMEEGIGLILNQGYILSLIMRYRRK